MKHKDLFQWPPILLFSLFLSLSGCKTDWEEGEGTTEEDDEETTEEWESDIKGAVVNTLGYTLSFIHIDEAGEITIENDAVATGPAANQVILTFRDAYVLNSSSSSVQKVSLEDYTSSEVSTGEGSNPYWMALADQELWVVNLLDNNVAIIDTLSMELQGFVELPEGSELNPYDGENPGNPLPSGIVYHDGEVYVSLANLGADWSPAGKGHLARLNTGTKQVEEVFEMEGENSTFLYSYGENIFVVNSGSYFTSNGNVDVFSPSDGSVIATIETGGNPGKLLVACDKGYLTDGSSTDVTVFDPVNFTITKSIEVVDPSLTDWNYVSGLALLKMNTIAYLSFNTDEIYLANCTLDVFEDETFITGDGPVDIDTTL